jgi:hypothetical protein
MTLPLPPADTRLAKPMSRRALNRALLARQWLLERQRRPALEATKHLVGMQAQAPNPPYVGLWSRLSDFRPEELARLLVDRQVVRIALMRGTIHLVTASDALNLRPLLQPVLDRALKANYGKSLAGLDLAEVAAAGRAVLAEQPCTPGELGRLMQRRWPDRDGTSLANAVRNLVPLIQLPPRGVWGVGGATTYATAEDWLGHSLATDPSLDDLVLRYLAAFGPATIRDLQAWSGLTHLGEVVERLGPELVTSQDEQGRQLFDRPDAPRPDPDTPAPVRLLAEFDNVLLAHADRARIVSEEHRKKVMTVNGLVLGSLLVDGFIAGTWRINRQAGGATLVVQPFVRLSKPDHQAAEAEANRLLEFTGDDTGPTKVEFAPPVF